VPISRPSPLSAYPTPADMKSAFKGMFKSSGGSGGGGGGGGKVNSAPSGSGESGWEDFSSFSIGTGTGAGGTRAASARVDPHPLTTDWAGRA